MAGWRVLRGSALRTITLKKTISFFRGDTSVKKIDKKRVAVKEFGEIESGALDKLSHSLYIAIVLFHHR